MPIVQVPADRIVDSETFHDVFSEVLGFPDFYGRNMNAWIDCLTYRDAPGDGMATVTVGPGDELVLEIQGAAAFRARCPDQYAALVECSAFVNWRRLQVGDRPYLVLAFDLSR